MKRCKKITGWTDYPFESLGDDPSAKALIRHITVLYFDGYTYATVQTDCGMITITKACYLYKVKARLVHGLNRKGKLQKRGIHISLAKLRRGIYSFPASI